jgi:hypothetical protein
MVPPECRSDLLLPVQPVHIDIHVVMCGHSIDKVKFVKAPQMMSKWCFSITVSIISDRDFVVFVHADDCPFLLAYEQPGVLRFCQ